MSYRSEIEVKELTLRIPREDFPFKSDRLVGYQDPKFYYQIDECEDDVIVMNQLGDFFVFNGKSFHGCDTGSCWLEELESLCRKYGGTLIADDVGEDGEINYVRIREGTVKKVRVVEED